MSADPGSAPDPDPDPGPAPTDSGGISFAGRTLTPSPFAGDDGSVDEALAAALGLGSGAGSGSGVMDVAAVHAALLEARVFVPVLAVSGDSGADGGDAGADMALPVLRAPDGREALPVFSCVETLTRWDARARPVPALARRAALSAVGEERQLMVLDVAGPTTAVLPRPALWALARGQEWVPAPRDPEVVAAVVQAATGVTDVVTAEARAGERSEVRVSLAVTRGLDRSALKRLTTAVTTALGASEVVAERVDSFEIEIVAAPAAAVASTLGTALRTPVR